MRSVEFERYRRKLAKAKVQLVSITQDVGEGATGDLVRSILSKFDEYRSAETAKHVRRSMVANARDGFWNGSRPPLGYKVVIAERRGDKDKKNLAVDETEAPRRLLRLLFLWRRALSPDPVSAKRWTRDWMLPGLLIGVAPLIAQAIGHGLGRWPWSPA